MLAAKIRSFVFYFACCCSLVFRSIDDNANGEAEAEEKSVRKKELVFFTAAAAFGCATRKTNFQVQARDSLCVC